MTDERRDPHLREALRHAPDAQVQPPSALSALILSEARAKVRDAAPQATRGPLAALWGWLARPSVAAGFAAVMVATLVGVMWWDQPMDEALPRRPDLAGAAAPTAPPATSTPDAALKPAPAAQPERRAPEPPRVALRKEAAATADKKAIEEKSDTLATQPAAPVQSPKTPEPLQRQDAAVTMRAAPAAVAPAPAPEREPAPAVAAGSMADNAALAELPRAARAKASPSAAAPAVPEQRPEESFVARERGVAAALDSSTGRYTLTAPPLTPLRTQIAREPASWTWQRDDGIAHAMNDTVIGWLTSLDRSAGTSWKPRTAADNAAPRGRELRLLRDGRELHVMRIVGDAVLWEREGSPLRAALPPATLDALQSTLDTAAP